MVQPENCPFRLDPRGVNDTGRGPPYVSGRRIVATGGGLQRVSARLSDDGIHRVAEKTRKPDRPADHGHRVSRDPTGNRDPVDSALARCDRTCDGGVWRGRSRVHLVGVSVGPLVKPLRPMGRLGVGDLVCPCRYCVRALHRHMPLLSSRPW